MKKRTKYLLLAAALCLLVCLVLLLTGKKPEPVTLRVSLYKTLPDYEGFEKKIAECWNEKHPEVKLEFADWDCYSGDVPEDLDVFVIDAISLDAYAGKGVLLPLSKEEIRDYEDLIPSFAEGCRVDGTLYVVPQLLCTELLYTRKEDTALKDVQSIDELREALEDRELILEKMSALAQVCRYLQALMDENKQYMDHFPVIEKGKLSGTAADSLRKMRELYLPDPEGVSKESGWYPSARLFAGGRGRAYIGYSEAMDVMGEKASDMDFRLFSMTNGENIPVFYVDAAAVNAKIAEEKRGLALEFLNMITGRELLARVLANDGNPRYLLSARYSVYDELGAGDLIYAKLKTVAAVPRAFVFRIKPDGDAYLDAAAEKVETENLYD